MATSVRTDDLTRLLRRYGWLLAALAAIAAALAVLPVTAAGALALAIACGIALLRYPVIGLYALALAVPLGPQLRLPLGFGAVGVTDVLVAATLASWLLRQIAFRPPLRPAPLLWVLSPLAIVLLFSTLAAQSLEAALPELIKWVEVLVVYFLAVQLADARHRLPLALTLVIAAAAEALIGVRQFVFGVGPEAFELGGVVRAYGTFGQPNPFAGYLGLALPLALALCLGALHVAWQRRRRGRLLIRPLALAVVCAGLAALLAAGLAASLSRGGWLGAGLAVVFVLAMSSLGSRIILLVGALALLLAPRLLPASLIARLADIGTYFGTWNARGTPVTDENFSVLERVAHWQVAWEMFADHRLLGIGVGNWDAVYPRYAFGLWSEPLGHAHNVLFHMAAEAGLLGALAYLWLWFGSLGAAMLAVVRNRGWDRVIAIGVTGMLIHLSVHNLFDNLWVQGMPLVVALALGLLVVAKPGSGQVDK